MVIAHGFGSGLGFFFPNVDPLLESGRIGRLLLVDWMGMGGSDRPPCRRPIRGLTGWCDSCFSAPDAAGFFTDPLDRWMDDHDVGGTGEEVWLVGHSLGGYLAARYALGRPERVDKLVLASPVGLSPRPTDALPRGELPAGIRLIDALWSANVTPQALVRLAGSVRGRSLVSRALRGRIPHLDGGQAGDLLEEYLYQITAARPSGEFAMNSLLEPAVSRGSSGGVYARDPLEGPLGDLPVGMRLKVLYGDQDWMRPANEESARRVTERLGQHRAEVHIMPRSGHHLYIDNSDAFVQHILS